MKRKPRRKPVPIPEPSGEDAMALADALRALVHGGGRGQLTQVATELGLMPSAFRKRLLRDGAGLDEASIKAVVLIAERKDENYTGWQIAASANVGGYVITTRTLNGQRAITWRLAPGKSE